MSQICPKCGSITEHNTYYRKITCTNCNWEGELDKFLFIPRDKLKTDIHPFVFGADKKGHSFYAFKREEGPIEKEERKRQEIERICSETDIDRGVISFSRRNLEHFIQRG